MDFNDLQRNTPIVSDSFDVPLAFFVFFISICHPGAETLDIRIMNTFKEFGCFSPLTVATMAIISSSQRPPTPSRVSTPLLQVINEILGCHLANFDIPLNWPLKDTIIQDEFGLDWRIKSDHSVTISGDVTANGVLGFPLGPIRLPWFGRDSVCAHHYLSFVISFLAMVRHTRHITAQYITVYNKYFWHGRYRRWTSISSW